LLFIAGYCIFSWAMITNRFFSLRARIQQEKGHYPVTTGPYRFVRHPGYLGMLLVVLMQPLILGSIWAAIPALATAGLLLWRTDLEDGTLMLELKGYEEYAWTVKYRLVPGVW
jgi:protein-S-isoprenylcysteine O-methyltransferase Ste14